MKVLRAFLLFLLLLDVAVAQTPTATVIDVPGARQTQAFGINNVGQIVGYYQSADGGQHAFVRDYGGSYMEINYPGARLTMANAVNDEGRIVGCYEDTNGVIHGFTVDHAGAYTAIDVPGASYTMAAGINNLSQVVGYYERDEHYHGFLLTNGTFTDVDVVLPNSGLAAMRSPMPTYPSGINDSGDIAGYYEPPFSPDIPAQAQFGTIQGFYYKSSDRRYDVTGILGGGMILSLNNDRFLIGSRANPVVGFVGRRTLASVPPLIQLRDLTLPSMWRGSDWREDYPLGVNNAKTIVGYFIGQDRLSHAFMFDCAKCS